MDKQKKKCADFIKEKLLPGKDDHRIWTNLLKKRTNYWSGKELLGKSASSDGEFFVRFFSSKISEDRDTAPLGVLRNWQHVFHLLESSIICSSSLFRVFLTLSESIFGGKIGSTVTHLAGMDTWRDYMVWAIRDKELVSEIYF